jgi:hypothetical protein
MAQEEKVWTEEIKVKGEALMGKVKELVREGNVRRIIIKNSDGQSVIEIPLTLGVVGAVLAPMLAAVGAVAALAADWSIEVERRGPAEGATEAATKPAKKTSAKSPAKKTSAKTSTSTPKT